MENITEILNFMAKAMLGVAVLVGIVVTVFILIQKKDLDRLIFVVLTVNISAYGLFIMFLLWQWALALAVISLMLSIGFSIYSIARRKPLHSLYTLFSIAVWLLLIFFSAAELAA